MGHSYGAFMTANLLAHSDLFRAGIARSGAYNRTLTPYGFQAEERTYWQAPEVYFKMSPFSYADKIKTPILLMHGEADDNQGTFPVQSERFYEALKGQGATVRLVWLPTRAARLPGPGVDAARPLGDERLAGPVGEDRAGERGQRGGDGEVAAKASCGAEPAPTSGRTAGTESLRPAAQIPLPKDPPCPIRTPPSGSLPAARPASAASSQARAGARLKAVVTARDASRPRRTVERGRRAWR